MEETQLLFFVMLMGMFWCDEGPLWANDSSKPKNYKDEAIVRMAESKQLQKAFDGEIMDKALEAKSIIQNHLNDSYAKPKSPCLGEVDAVAAADHTHKEGGCLVVPPNQKAEVNAKTSLNNTNQLIVFVSFSMPDASLKALFAALDTNLDVKLVIRGLVDDSMDKTARKISDLGGVLEINPELFDHYQIIQVPTFVLVKKSGETFKLAGNVTLNYAREILNKGIVKDACVLEKTA
jgi:conjugal transfer pilus assembly protein TrbC